MRVEEERQTRGRERQAWLERQIDQAGIERRFQGKTLENYLAESDGQAKALKVARRYLDSLAQRIFGGDCLVFCGGPGTGKSHLIAGIISGAIQAGRTAAYLSVYDLILMARSTYGRGDSTLKELLGPLFEVDLLALDEVGAKVGSEDGMLIATIIDSRYARQKPTLVATNLAPSALEEYIGARLFDRLLEGKGVVVPFDWPSHRRRRALSPAREGA
ncbi:MAG: ATP-binding protein [Magnetococcales bacterium]|nr:ATP-binding protein [Magnetococcales bacterium]